MITVWNGVEGAFLIMLLLSGFLHVRACCGYMGSHCLVDQNHKDT